MGSHIPKLLSRAEGKGASKNTIITVNQMSAPKKNGDKKKVQYTLPSSIQSTLATTSSIGYLIDYSKFEFTSAKQVQSSG
jgi:hypothetical protein